MVKQQACFFESLDYSSGYKKHQHGNKCFVEKNYVALLRLLCIDEFHDGKLQCRRVALV